jgi:hypothetical protein
MKQSFSGNNLEKSKLRQKTPEEIQAQIAAYASEKIDDNHTREYVFTNIVDLAAGKAEDLTRVREDDESGNLINIPTGTERTIEAKGYSEFLRSVDGSKYEAIQGRAEILRAYKDFAPAVSELKENLKAISSLKEHTSYLGSGSHSSVFFIERESKKYAVRIPQRSEKVSASEIDQHVAAAVLSKGVPHLEQIIGASYEDGVTVAELMPGTHLGDLDVESVRAITDEQLNELVNTLTAAHERGIYVDTKPSNFFYDREMGFGIVDLASAKVMKNSEDQDLSTIIEWAAVAILNMGTYGQPHAEISSIEECAQELEFSKVRLGILSRYRKCVETQLKGDGRERVLQSIDTDIQRLEAGLTIMSNPEWAAERIRLNVAAQGEGGEK